MCIDFELKLLIKTNLWISKIIWNKFYYQIYLWKQGTSLCNRCPTTNNWNRSEIAYFLIFFIYYSYHENLNRIKVLLIKNFILVVDILLYLVHLFAKISLFRFLQRRQQRLPISLRQQKSQQPRRYPKKTKNTSRQPSS